MAVWGGVLLAGAARAEEPLEYNRDIRPILAENCFRCHGPDSAARQAELRLDQRQAAIDAAAIAPGDPDSSELVRRINSPDPEERMPPESSHKKLSAKQKETLRRWIAAGAEYQPHWSFIPPARPEPPQVKNPAWCRNPIDYFVLARLEAAGLAPAPEADRRTLARRLSLDLTGLPPAPELVERFVRDSAAGAYERLVDELLASNHWGEHRGRYWLDAARYADTHGIHFDNYREAWAYRDWVIRAFNRNLPFDRFTIEQLAGDLLPEATLDQQVASGFNRCNITTNEGGIIDEEYLVLYTRDRTETTSQVWMGMTAGCAVCHDHKFDPLTQREFYEMAAFFNNTTQAAKDGNIKDTPPVLVVPQPQDRARWDALVEEIDKIKPQADARRKAARPEFEKWAANPDPQQVAGTMPEEGLRLHAALDEGAGAKLTVAVDGTAREIELAKAAEWKPGHVAEKAFQSGPETTLQVADAGDFEKDQPFTCAVWLRPGRGNLTGAIVARMDDQQGYRGWDLWLENGRVGSHLIHQWDQDACKVVTRTPLRPGQWNHVVLLYDGTGKAEGIQFYVNGQRQDTNVARNTLKNSIRTGVPLKVAQRHTQSRLDGIQLQDLRLYDRALTSATLEQVARTARATYLAAKPAEKRSAAEKEELYEWWIAAVDEPYRELAARLAPLEAEQATIRAGGTVAHVMSERPSEAMAYILFRGEYDKRRDPVKASTPDFLPEWPEDLPSNRLGFAQWLLSPEHPLTARVTVNRFWQEMFGTGLVRTAGDFGVSGELPSHPELLDWLAVEFRETGWDMKRFFRLLVTSAAYRQSSQVTPAKLEKDAENRLLSRGPRFRMDAEMIRDYALAASGLLAPKIGGPSVKPYQPEGVWEAVAMIGSNTRDYRPDSGESLYRRSLYTFWKRAAPPASMEIFNAPNREFCTVRRERTNTPLQALVTLNDPQFVEAARHLAQRTLKDGGAGIESRIDYMAVRLLARPLRSDELQVVQATLDDLLSYYRGHTEDAKQLISVGESKPDPSLDPSTLAAWTMLANELMNLDEVLNK
jgi:hypothetical protein